MDKVDRIKELLEQGKTTREIAQELRVSLRDVHRVRMQKGIDIGKLERDRDRLESEIVNKQQQVSQLNQQIQRLMKQRQNLETEIERKKAEVLRIGIRVEPIYFPSNYADVEGVS